MPTRTFDIPPRGHTLSDSTKLRQITEEGGVAVGVELKPQVPHSSGDLEFDSADLSAWTQVNAANASVIDANTTYKGYLFFNLNATASDLSGASGPFVHQAKSGDFDVMTRLRFGSWATGHQCGIVARSSSDSTDYVNIRAFASSVGPSLRLIFDSVVNGGNTFTAVSSPADTPSIGGFIYLRLRRAGNVFTGYYSFTGDGTWTSVASATRADFSADAQLGPGAGAGNTSNACVVLVDYLRNVPPLPTDSPTSTVEIDSGVNGTVWDMSTFDAFANPYEEVNPQSQIGYGSIKFQYGAGNSTSPALNGAYLTEAQMQAESDPTGRYLRIQVQYNSATGYDRARFSGAKIDGTFTASGSSPTLGRGTMRGTV